MICQKHLVVGCAVHAADEEQRNGVAGRDVSERHDGQADRVSTLARWKGIREEGGRLAEAARPVAAVARPDAESILLLLLPPPLLLALLLLLLLLLADVVHHELLNQREGGRFAVGVRSALLALLLLPSPLPLPFHLELLGQRESGGVVALLGLPFLPPEPPRARERGSTVLVIVVVRGEVDDGAGLRGPRPLGGAGRGCCAPWLVVPRRGSVRTSVHGHGRGVEEEDSSTHIISLSKL